MSRIVRAAKVLYREVKEHRPEAVMETTGELDGFSVYRTVVFDRPTSLWLTPLLKEIDDPRIEQLTTDMGRLSVTFVEAVKADFSDPFPLAAAQVVVSARPRFG